MLDIRFIKDNLEAVRQRNIRDRYMDADVDLLISLYDKKNALLRELEGIQALQKRMLTMKSNLSKKERSIRIEEGKRLKRGQ